MQAQTEFLLGLAENTVGTIGRPFLDGLSQSLRDGMNVSVAVMTERVGGPTSKRVRSIVAIAGGEQMDMEYDLAGTPCEVVYGGKIVRIDEGLADKFEVAPENYASYIGVPLRAGEPGEVTGHLSVMSEKPLAEPELAEAILRIYAQRAETEIRRVAADAERDRLLEELKTLNKRLTDNYERVRSANAYKGQALGMVAHDLKNPIGQILGFADLASMGLDNPNGVDGESVKQDLAQIRDVGAKMLGQVQRILDGARKEATELPLNPQPMDFRDVLEQAVQVNALAASEKGIQIRYDGPASVPAVADQELVLEAVDNLISNAVKYSYPHSPVTVSARSDGDGVTVSVSDKGQGLDEDDLAKAFGRFQRLSSTPTAGEDSTGLGLYNVRMVAERHSGRVWAESAGKGEGAVFHLFVPQTLMVPAEQAAALEQTVH